MTNVELIKLITANSTRITEAISTGAAWEIWMQVELILILRQNKIQAAREVPYASGSNNYLDALAQDAQGIYAIELKVESANNSGAALLTAMQNDRTKIAAFPSANANARWVLSMAYSALAKSGLQSFANTPANNAVYVEVNGIGVFVAAV